MAFLEEVINGEFSYQSSYGDSFAVEESEQFKNRYTVLKHPFIMSQFRLMYPNKTNAALATNIIGLFHRARGRTDGFRMYNPSDYSSNGLTGTPTEEDQLCTVISKAAGTYQLTKWYSGTQGDSDAGRRLIKKPRAGTVLVAENDSGYTSYSEGVDYAIDMTTGIITLTTPFSGSETLHAGFKFDVPVVFNDDLDDIEYVTSALMSTGIELKEILNP